MMSRGSSPGNGQAASQQARDARFAVEYDYRLRFTARAFDPGNPLLVEVLGAGGLRPARAVVFLDDGVVRARPDLPAQVEAYAEAHADGLHLAGPAQVVAGGEQAKNDWSVYHAVSRAIDAAGLCRHSFVVSVGGGAMLDAVGFAASTAHRGLRQVRLPSTTLAQADAGIGVKNGINAFGKKNFLGVFSPPWAVINDATFLATLSDRDWRCGIAEAIKVGLVKDASLFRYVADHADRLQRRDTSAMRHMIRRSAELHLEHIVTGGDPFEMHEARPLDFGHWSAHRLEQMTGAALRHGEAVAIGVALDVVYSALLGWLDAAEAQAILAALERVGFSLYHPALAETDQVLAGLEEFRAHLGGQLTISLLRGIGRAEDVGQIDSDRVAAAIDQLASRAGAPVSGGRG